MAIPLSEQYEAVTLQGPVPITSTSGFRHKNRSLSLPQDYRIPNIWFILQGIWEPARFKDDHWGESLI